MDVELEVHIISYPDTVVVLPLEDLGPYLGSYFRSCRLFNACLIFCL